MPQKEYINRVIPIGALYAASLWLSNSAYLHLSVSFIQMTKAGYTQHGSTHSLNTGPLTHSHTHTPPPRLYE